MAMSDEPTTDDADALTPVQRALTPFLTALMFLTRIPCPRWVGHGADALARSTVYFPVIGLLVGGVGAATFAVVQLAWPPLLALVAAMASTVWLTGAFHEDGLADTFDGFGGGWTRDDVLRIMKDSRVGTYGVAALVLVMAGKLAALAALPVAEVPVALVAGHVLGRASSLPLIGRYDYVRDDSATGKPFAASVTPVRLAVGVGGAVAATGALLWADAALALGAAVVVTVGAGRAFESRIGGITGDTLGAANQLVELAVYVALASTLAL